MDHDVREEQHVYDFPDARFLLASQGSKYPLESPGLPVTSDATDSPGTKGSSIAIYLPTHLSSFSTSLFRIPHPATAVIRAVAESPSAPKPTQAREASRPGRAVAVAVTIKVDVWLVCPTWLPDIGWKCALISDNGVENRAERRKTK